MYTELFCFIFIPILVFILLLINFFLAFHNPYLEKKSVFECGFHSFLGQNRVEFSISFFIFCLLFLIFDIEILLIYPLIISFYLNETVGFYVFLLFTLLLTLGFVFEIGRKVLFVYSKQSTNEKKNKYFSKPDLIIVSIIRWRVKQKDLSIGKFITQMYFSILVILYQLIIVYLFHISSQYLVQNKFVLSSFLQSFFVSCIEYIKDIIELFSPFLLVILKISIFIISYYLLYIFLKKTYLVIKKLYTKIKLNRIKYITNIYILIYLFIIFIIVIMPIIEMLEFIINIITLNTDILQILKKSLLIKYIFSILKVLIVLISKLMIWFLFIGGLLLLWFYYSCCILLFTIFSFTLIKETSFFERIMKFLKGKKYRIIFREWDYIIFNLLYSYPVLVAFTFNGVLNFFGNFEGLVYLSLDIINPVLSLKTHDVFPLRHSDMIYLKSQKAIDINTFDINSPIEEELWDSWYEAFGAENLFGNNYREESNPEQDLDTTGDSQVVPEEHTPEVSLNVPESSYLNIQGEGSPRTRGNVFEIISNDSREWANRRTHYPGITGSYYNPYSNINRISNVEPEYSQDTRITSTYYPSYDSHLVNVENPSWGNIYVNCPSDFINLRHSPVFESVNSPQTDVSTTAVTNTVDSTSLIRQGNNPISLDRNQWFTGDIRGAGNLQLSNDPLSLDRNVGDSTDIRSLYYGSSLIQIRNEGQLQRLQADLPDTSSNELRNIFYEALRPIPENSLTCDSSPQEVLTEMRKAVYEIGYQKKYQIYDFDPTNVKNAVPVTFWETCVYISRGFNFNTSDPMCVTNNMVKVLFRVAIDEEVNRREHVQDIEYMVSVLKHGDKKLIEDLVIYSLNKTNNKPKWQIISFLERYYRDPMPWRIF